MKSQLLIKLREERGVAMIVVLISVLVVTVIGGALMVSSLRDLESSTSVQRASTALGMAEAAIQHAIQQVKKFGPLSPLITKCVPDQSGTPGAGAQCPAGEGRWMSPDDPATAEHDPGKAPLPLDDQYVGFVANGKYTAHIRAEDPISLPHKREGVYKIVATGFDRRDRPGRPGERTVEQFLFVKTLDLPFGLFAQNGVNSGGTPRIMSESIWTQGDMLFRNSINFEPPGTPDPACPYPSGCDLFYGWDGANCGSSPSGADPCPVTAHASGTIYRGNATANPQNGPIHKAPFPLGYQNCEFPYDRDLVGGPYDPPGWLCAAVGPAPPYGSSRMTAFPFETSGPSADTYEFLKQLAQAGGTFCTHTSNNSIGISATGQPASPHPCERIGLNAVPRGFFVLYVEAPQGAGDVGIKTGWGIQSDQPDQVTPCDPDGNFGVIVVRRPGGAGVGGIGPNLSWQNNQTWWGAAFVPDGEFRGSGTGSGGWFVGTVFAKNIGNTGNMKFQLNDCWVTDLAGPWFAISRLRWHESDR